MFAIGTSSKTAFRSEIDSRSGDDSKALGLKLFAEVLLEDALMHANKATAPEIESDLRAVRAWLAPRRVAASRTHGPTRFSRCAIFFLGAC